MRLKKEIYLALTSDEGFIELMESFEGSKEVKFELAQDEVRKYIPGFKNYKNYEAMRLSKKTPSKKPKVNNEFVLIPVRVAKAIGSKNGFRELYYWHLGRSKSNELAYIAACKAIQRHLPSYKPYKNYGSFRECLNVKLRRRK